LNDVAHFFLESCMRERIGGNAKICSQRTNMWTRLEIKDAGLERIQLEEWLKMDFRNYEIQDTPFGFLAYVPDLTEFLVVTISANQEFVSRFHCPLL